jgi:hypothetical protein
MAKQGDKEDHQHRDPHAREGDGAALLKAVATDTALAVATDSPPRLADMIVQASQVRSVPATDSVRFCYKVRGSKSVSGEPRVSRPKAGPVPGRASRYSEAWHYFRASGHSP